jgi:hypothetical protein
MHYVISLLDEHLKVPMVKLQGSLLLDQQLLRTYIKQL